MASNRDTYRYELRDLNNRVVYVGITKDPDRREAQHQRDGKRFLSPYVHCRARGHARVSRGLGRRETRHLPSASWRKESSLQRARAIAGRG